MRRIISICLLLAILISSFVCVQATGSQVAFTSGSSFAVGGTASVDLQKTAANVMDSPSVTSDLYNAALEKNMDVMWKCSNGTDKKGNFVTWSAEDVGKEYVCRIGFYADKELTQFIDYIDSDPFVVTGGSGTAGGKIPTIADRNLEIGKVGVAYYQKLTCSDPDATWSLFRSSLPEGLYLTQHGEIEGTPTKAGEFYVVVMATPEAGEDFAATAEFELSIADADEQLYTMEIRQVPKKLEYTAGEKLDMTGLRVRIYGPDGYLDSENGQYLMYSDKALVTVGEQKIALQYKDAFDVFIVTVKAAPNAEDPTEPTTETVEDPTEAPATEKETEPTSVVDEPTETTATTEPAETTAQVSQPASAAEAKKDSSSVWVFVGIGLGAVVIGLTVVIVLMLRKKKNA